MIKILIICEREQSAEILELARKTAKEFFMQELRDKQDKRMSGEELKKIREELHMTQERFANEITATDQSVISRMEAGKTKVSEEVAKAAISAKDLRSSNGRKDCSNPSN